MTPVEMHYCGGGGGGVVVAGTAVSISQEITSEWPSDNSGRIPGPSSGVFFPSVHLPPAFPHPPLAGTGLAGLVLSLSST